MSTYPSLLLQSVHIYGVSSFAGHGAWLRTVLSLLPGLRAVTFERPAHAIPWSVFEVCFSYPNIKAIRFDPSARYTKVMQYPHSLSPGASSVEELHYPASVVLPQPAATRGFPSTPLEKQWALESAYLSSLVLSMHHTVRSLSLPLETAPLADMATVDWPSLQMLSLEGVTPRDVNRQLRLHLPVVLHRTCGLRHLILNGALPRSTTGRGCILGHHMPPGSEPLDLRSLVLSYPDPNDAIFSASMPHLLYLSLRDWPRHYDFRVLSFYHSFYRSPLLSATETLSILERLRSSELKTLELVYRADEADDDLLNHVVTAFPKLRYLEIHRYRQRRGSTVDYGHIARIISSVKTLVTLRLHLDTREDPGAYAYDIDSGGGAVEKWYTRLVKCGWDILKLLAPCPELESVALVYSAAGPPSSWLWFHRSHFPAREVVRDPWSESPDSHCRPSRRRRFKVGLSTTL
ncbi:hypothetical protein C8Q77DRAFT_856074 [Trametes polyzona]|nr:hypothetical protein C8Q77DRAFT_856074 [Trametes polyzona]